MFTVAFLLDVLAVVLAVALAYFYHAPWYWHVLSVLAALALGFSPPIPGWQTASRDLVYGVVVLFLLVWGFAEPFVHRFHRHSMKPI
jgi:hypothetical protein